jgi:ribulose-5-phosphate 4-epimerase/fuculose-1-phosphate aldolase
MSEEVNPIAFSAVFLSKTPPNDVRIAQLADWGKKLHATGLVQGTEGNLSFRSKLGFVITGTNVPLNSITPDNVAEVTGVVYGLNKTSVYIKGTVVPSRETILHSQVYETRPDINVIYHVHDTRVMEKAAKLGIPVTAREQPAGSLELAKEAVSLLAVHQDTRYFVLNNHGTVSLGRTLDEAGNLVEEMRKKCK